MTCSILPWSVAANCQSCHQPAEPIHQVRDDERRETRMLCQQCCPRCRMSEPLQPGEVKPIAVDAKQESLFETRINDAF